MKLLISFVSLLMSLWQAQPKPQTNNQRYLTRGYWISTQYKLGVDPNTDSSFLPIHYIYSDGRKYYVATHRDEEIPVRVKMNPDGFEQLIGIVFNANYVKNEFVGYRFYVKKEGALFYMIAIHGGKSSKILLRKKDKL